MTKDQTILIVATNMACALAKDDNLKDLAPQAAMAQLCKYLDSTVPAMVDRVKYYSEQYGLDLTTFGGDGSQDGSVMGDLAKAAPQLIALLPQIVKLFASK